MTTQKRSLHTTGSTIACMLTLRFAHAGSAEAGVTGGAGAGLDHRDLGLEEVAHQLGRRRAARAGELLVDQPLDRIADRQADQAQRRDVAPSAPSAGRSRAASSGQTSISAKRASGSFRQFRADLLQRRAQRDIDLAGLHHLR